MKIYTNIAALSARRMQNNNQSSISTALQRLSSGVRVNSAKDDAAGLAISERMTSLVKGLRQGMRNVNDGVSLLQTAEGGLSEIGNMLQRMRELAVQGANTGSLSYTDRKALQEEIKELQAEVTRTAKTTQFNGVNIINDYTVFAGDASEAKVALEDSLKRSWLEQAETLITTEYGLTADNVNLEIVYDDSYDGAGGIAAYVSGTTMTDGTGRVENLELHFDMEDFSSPVPTIPDGSPYDSYDRIVAHEMVHAVMDRTVNMVSMPTWFKEGAAEFLPGADASLNYYLSTSGAAALIVEVDNNDANWGSSGLEYAAGYAAVRYLHDALITAGNAGGLRDFMTWMAGAPATRTFDAAISNFLGGGGINNENDLVADFAANGAAFMAGLTLTGDETGGIGGADAGGGGSTGGRDTTYEGSVPDTDAYTDNPLSGFVEKWEMLTSNNGPATHMQFQVGANKGETISVGYAAGSAKSLGITDIDVVNNAQQAITKLDFAISMVSEQRARLGAQQNRLESAIRVNEVNAESLSAARSRIKDTDFAVETSRMTKGMILDQAATAMLSQAQATPQLALQLLNNL